MQWFARGRLWASREAERDDFQMRKLATAAPRGRFADRFADRPAGRPADRPEGAERRGSDWRPGGAHKDPRDRFKKKNRPERAWSEKDPATQRDRDKPGFASSSPRESRRSSSDPRTRPGGAGGKPAGDSPPSDRPWQTRPTGPRAQRKPWSNKPPDSSPRGDRPWSNKPPGGPPRGDRPWSNKPPGGPPRGDRPWSNKPPGGPPRAERKPWQNKPGGGDSKPFRPHNGPPGNGPRKKRDDEPPDRG